MRSLFRKGPEQPELRETALGTFMRIGKEAWEGWDELDGMEIRIDADDVRGEPDPRLLDYLSAHWRELPALASLARNALFAVSDKHKFDLISSSGSGDVCLGFSWRDGSWGETVFVHFKEGKIVTWDSAD